MPYEQILIPHLEEIKLEFREALEDHVGSVNLDDFLFLKNAERREPPQQSTDQTEDAKETK
jgi:hypothetical protein